MQLERALQSRVLIEQAKGILAERYGIAVDRAFQALRRAARDQRRNLHDLAALVVAERLTPPRVAARIRETQHGGDGGAGIASPAKGEEAWPP